MFHLQHCFLLGFIKKIKDFFSHICRFVVFQNNISTIFHLRSKTGYCNCLNLYQKSFLYKRIKCFKLVTVPVPLQTIVLPQITLWTACLYWPTRVVARSTWITSLSYETCAAQSRPGSLSTQNEGILIDNIEFVNANLRVATNVAVTVIYLSTLAKLGLLHAQAYQGQQTWIKRNILNRGLHSLFTIFLLPDVRLIKLQIWYYCT